MAGLAWVGVLVANVRGVVSGVVSGDVSEHRTLATRDHPIIGDFCTRERAALLRTVRGCCNRDAPMRSGAFLDGFGEGYVAGMKDHGLGVITVLALAVPSMAQFGSQQAMLRLAPL